MGRLRLYSRSRGTRVDTGETGLLGTFKLRDIFVLNLSDPFLEGLHDLLEEDIYVIGGSWLLRILGEGCHLDVVAWVLSVTAP
jgi:hypothetical protein